MKTLTTQKSLVILGVFVLLAFFGYNFFAKDSVEVGVVSTTNMEEGADILVMVDTLKKITIDKTLFTSDLFLGLRDFTVSLYPEQQGRPNPFASIGGESANPAQTPPPKKTVQ
ncbi:MAG: hypothetical protein EXS47_00890 [Candidatus Zambryskibacteria bacterium]|nr:hypothetical protein [Candidatus Zambryskibacteria bacterium]